MRKHWKTRSGGGFFQNSGKRFTTGLLWSNAPFLTHRCLVEKSDGRHLKTHDGHRVLKLLDCHSLFSWSYSYSQRSLNWITFGVSGTMKRWAWFTWRAGLLEAMQRSGEFWMRSEVTGGAAGARHLCFLCVFSNWFCLKPTNSDKEEGSFI